MTKKILLVDDDKQFVKNLQAELAGDSDIEVLALADGTEVLETARQEQPDVIMLDIVLPGELGLSVMEKLKSDKATKFISIIAVSNFGGGAYDQRALGLGADEFINKANVTMQELADKLRDYLQSGATSD